MAKRYYWFKMRSDFFDSIEIKRLKKIAGGDTYIVLYINLLSHSVKTEGCLQFKHVEPTIEDELALILDCEAEMINFLLKFLYSYNLLTIDGDNYYLLEAVSHIGTESESAERTRQYRARKKQLQLNSQAEILELPPPSQCDNNVTVDNSPSQCNNNVTDKNNILASLNTYHNVTQEDHNVTNTDHIVMNSHNVHICDTDKETEEEIRKDNKPFGDSDNFGLSILDGFNLFLKLYPREQHNHSAVYNEFISLVNEGVAISDLLSSAKTYSESVRKENIESKFIKMPANFLKEQLWIKYIPKYQIDCPRCSGQGVTQEKSNDGYNCVQYCTCKNRYNKFAVPQNMLEIINKLKSNPT